MFLFLLKLGLHFVFFHIRSLMGTKAYLSYLIWEEHILSILVKLVQCKHFAYKLHADSKCLLSPYLYFPLSIYWTGFLFGFSWLCYQMLACWLYSIQLLSMHSSFEENWMKFKEKHKTRFLQCVCLWNHTFKNELFHHFVPQFSMKVLPSVWRLPGVTIINGRMQKRPLI